MNDYEKLATRARELLNVYPRPANEDVADQILGEIYDESLSRPAFVERLRPAMANLVSTTISSIRKGILNEASAAYLAKPVSPPALPESEEVRHPGFETLQLNADSSDSERAESDHPFLGTHGGSVASPAPQADGQGDSGTHASGAVPVERVNGGGHAALESQRIDATPVTPLSLRAEVLPGWRSLKDESLFVPEHDGITYGTANREQWNRRLTWHHQQATGHIETSRKERKILEAIEAAGVNSLNELLDGRES